MGSFLVMLGWYLLATLLVLLFIGNLLTGVFQAQFIFRPRRLKKDYVYQFEERLEELDISTDHHGNLNALWYKIDEVEKRRGVVLFFHGNAGSLARWGHLYHYFAQFGYDYFVYDYRGYGKSTGPRSQRIMYDDALAVYHYLRQSYAPEDIVLYGRSMGSAFATRVAAEQPARLLILETPFFSMRDLFYQYYPWLPRVFLFRYPLPTYQYLSETSCAVHVFQGTRDFVVPYASAKKLRQHLKPDDTFTTVSGAGHNNLVFYDVFNRKIREILTKDPV
jgi:pimeloyl-ACP methyl ester carboxylesterase